MWNFADAQDYDVMLPAPRKEGCIFKSVARNKEDQSVTFVFADATGAVLNHREFVPKRRNDTQSDADFKKDISLVASRLRHIAHAFMTDEEYTSIRVDGDPNDLSKAADFFTSVTKQIGKILIGKMTMKDSAGNPIPNPSFNGTCALKVIYRPSKGKYYASFPNIPPFISTDLRPKEFKIDPNFDFFEIPKTAPDAEKQTQQTGANTQQGGQQAGSQPAQNTASAGVDNEEF